MNLKREAASRMGLAYELLPRIVKTGRPTRTLKVLLAHPELGDEQIGSLASIELLNLYFDDIRNEVDLHVEIYVPRSLTAVIDAFDYYGTRYHVTDNFDFADSDVMHGVVKKLDCGVVLVANEDAIRKRNTDDIALVTHDVAIVLRECETHAKGFDAPWSFELPSKDAPWGQFYTMHEESIFRLLWEDLVESKEASEAVYETMRLLVNTISVLCYCRDRMAFYRQQDRWAMRAGHERQTFEFEYSTYLNLFYIGLYSAVDQVAGLVVRRFNLDVSPEHIGATYKKFRTELEGVPNILTIFNDADFWDWYGRVKSIRHDAAHNGLAHPLTIYLGDDNFTEEQMMKAAEDNDLLDDIASLPELMRSHVRNTALFRAKLILMGDSLRHVLRVTNNDAHYLYNPCPHTELEKFLSFFMRVLEQLKPWRDEPVAPFAAN